MQKSIVKETGDITIIDAYPVCGKDFCDACGDCLYCYWEDACYGNDGGEHIWVEYINEGDENG